MPDPAKPAKPWYDDLAPPAWFDPAKHRGGDGGVYELATGVLLDHDGVPVSGPIRAEREAELAAVAMPEAAMARTPAAAAPVQE